MKLLVVSTWWPYPLDNGSRVRAYHLIRHLGSRHEVTLVSFGLPRGGEDRAPLEACCAGVEVVSPVLLGAEGLGSHGLFSRTPRHFVQTDNATMRARVAALATSHDAAVALQIDAARYLAEVPSLPRVFDEVEVSVPREQYLRAPTWQTRARHGLTWWKFRGYVTGIIRAFDRATVVSGLEREALASMGCAIDRIDVVPNGVEVPPLGPPPTRVARLIYPGAVTFSANLDAVRYFVRDVFPVVRRQHPALEFMVTGATDGVDIGDLQQPGVVFTGRLPSVDPLVAHSAACVVPLRIGGGTRLKILQAMALGTPVVTTAKGAEGLDVVDDSHVLMADAPNDFARQVDRILTDPLLGARLRQEAWLRVKTQYDWSLIGEGLEASLQAAITQQATASS